MRRRRRFWEDEYHGGVSPDWVIVGLTIVVLAAAVFGFWFNDMYANHYGFFDTR